MQCGLNHGIPWSRPRPKRWINDYDTLFSVSVQRSSDYGFHGRYYDSMEGDLRAKESTVK